MYVNGIKFTAKPGRAAEVAAGALAVRGIVERVTGVEARAWSVIGGEDAGTFAVSTRVESMGQYIEGSAEIYGDPEFQALGSTLGDATAGPASIELHRLVSSTDGFTSKPIMSITSAIIAGGHYAEAHAWCAEFVDFVHATTGAQAAFVTGAAGAFGSVGLYVTSEDGDASDEIHGKLVAATGYIERLDAAGTLFEPGSGHQRLLSRLG